MLNIRFGPVNVHNFNGNSMIRSTNNAYKLCNKCVQKDMEENTSVYSDVHDDMRHASKP